MSVISNFLRNSNEIVKYCIENPKKFVHRNEIGGHQGPLPVSSEFYSFVDEEMDDDFIDLIFSNCDFDPDLRDLYYFIQIQMYKPGNYIVPHRDNYEVETLHLVTLTTSDVDALVVQADGKLIRIFDEAGQKIDYDLNNYHWVDPVKDLRFSLVIGE